MAARPYAAEASAICATRARSRRSRKHCPEPPQDVAGWSFTTTGLRMAHTPWRGRLRIVHECAHAALLGAARRARRLLGGESRGERSVESEPRWNTE
jgi:hypothetical protein